MGNILKIISLTALISTATYFPISAKDFGVVGQTFKIKEQSPINAIKSKLKNMENSGELAKMQKGWQEDAVKRTKRPKDALGNIKKTQREEIRYFDPAITVQKNLRGDKGQIFAYRGQVVNPFDHFNSYFPKMVVLDGDDKDQVAFAINYYQENPKAKLILVRGNIIDLMQTHNIRFFFDQNGTISNKFDLDRFPSVITREDITKDGKTKKMMKIWEVAL